MMSLDGTVGSSEYESASFDVQINAGLAPALTFTVEAAARTCGHVKFF
jgi:hypothetical protein